MPTIFLTKNASFPIGATAKIFGVIGNSKETVLLTDNRATDIEIYPSIERVEFTHPVGDYQFQIVGNIATIAIDGHVLATLTLNEKTELTFADGTANLDITGLGQAQLGGASLASQLQALTGVILDQSDVSTIGVLPVKDSIFSISPTIQNILEGALGAGNTTTVTVSRTDNLDQAVSIELNTHNSSADQGTDFSALPNLLNFAVNESSKDILIDIIGDNTFENDEIIHISLANPSQGANIGTANSTEITIQNDDALPTFSLSRSFAHILEEDNLMGVNINDQNDWII